MMRGRIDPLMIMFISIGIIIAFIGYNISTTIQHGNEVKQLLKENENAAESRANQLKLIEKIIQQQGNLTEERREALIIALEENVELVPEIKDDFKTMKDALVNLNNKVNELFLAKNATEATTNVFNGTALK